eukprot:7388530-Prymnesium_polylepis.1
MQPQHNTRGQRLSAHAPVTLQTLRSLPVPCPPPHDTQAALKPPHTASDPARTPPPPQLDAPRSARLARSPHTPFPPGTLGLGAASHRRSIPCSLSPPRHPHRALLALHVRALTSLTVAVSARAPAHAAEGRLPPSLQLLRRHDHFRVDTCISGGL